MNIGVVGTGYVGLVQGVILSEFGMNVTCVDIVEEKIQMLNRGELPIYEPGLKEILDKNVKSNRLKFTTDIKETTRNSKVIFIAVGTPPKDDGSADLTYVLEVARTIAENMNEYKVIVNKSTVPVGTGNLVKELIQDTLLKRGLNYEFDVVSNPEFLREGKAVKDCLTPDRIVIGTCSEKAKDIMKSVYDVLYINQTPFVFTNIETAEMIKYASNAFLAVKISFINEMALLSEKVGANIQEISKAMGMDGRISPKFLHAGPGYGGSCFPKDTRAIVDIAKANDEQMMVIEAAIKANEKQKRRMVEKIVSAMGNIRGKTFGVLGLSFKPETDDMRDAPSKDIIEGLIKCGAKVQAFCPQGMKEAKWRLEHLKDSIEYMEDEYTAAKNADAIIVVTEWHQFRGIDLEKISKHMNDNYIFDLRNIFSRKKELKSFMRYYGVGNGENML
ncbi:MULTISPECIES: UDP-glucose dehydrogenase family protein [Paenibacillus]|uniref:UDP-glucose dehydrogenase family protein n=1 Tax=Paenibacillus TaxID=44249 RepID=UPI00096F3B66|nr:UDP-glucose/GDP-mannose dehydrogenase family protein [Paenibacillus odorifer]MEC0132116.1 UDP-glucose/GDP-mannose dehydrogenase family protein [Paenibacillus odorifer]MEC0220188.1 UDP-glucose/GDP-mannose dehydrogenase family protein [Paenibacillus odorifer]OME47253.1 UDP-glucose 6-dehydrogenase [Paenibacillus odorifer]